MGGIVEGRPVAMVIGGIVQWTQKRSRHAGRQTGWPGSSQGHVPAECHRGDRTASRTPRGERNHIRCPGDHRLYPGPHAGARPATPPVAPYARHSARQPLEAARMDLGACSISLPVKDLAVSCTRCEKLGLDAAKGTTPPRATGHQHRPLSAHARAEHPDIQPELDVRRRERRPIHPGAQPAKGPQGQRPGLRRRARRVNDRPGTFRFWSILMGARCWSISAGTTIIQ